MYEIELALLCGVLGPISKVTTTGRGSTWWEWPATKVRIAILGGEWYTVDIGEDLAMHHGTFQEILDAVRERENVRD